MALVKNNNQGKGPASFQIPNLPLPTTLPIPNDLIPNSVLGKGTRGNPSGKFVPLDLPALEKLTTQYDKLGYDTSDADFAKRFPGLVAGRDIAINSAGAGIAGQTDPFVQGTLATAGLGDEDFGQGPGNQARNLGISIADMNTRDRGYFRRLLNENPQRAFGLGTKDIENAYGVQQKIRNDQSAAEYQGALNNVLSQSQQQSQNYAAAIGGITKTIGTLGQAGNRYLSPTNYGGFGSPAAYDYNAATQAFGNYGTNWWYDAGGNPVSASGSSDFSGWQGGGGI